MAGFLYRVLLQLIDPTTFAIALLAAAPLLGRRRALRRSCYGVGLAMLIVCGNEWVIRALTLHLESQYPAPDVLPNADAIVVLSGSTYPRTPPRRTVEVSEAGDRVIYGAELFHRGLAPRVICTGGVAMGGIAARSEAEDTADVLASIGVPRASIQLETAARNTHEHAVNLCPVFQERGIRRVLLVTTATHMPRSIGVFRQSCPAVEYVPAPTDFHAVEEPPAPWYRELAVALPTPHNLEGFSVLAHEYVGLFYYRLRGWV